MFSLFLLTSRFYNIFLWKCYVLRQWVIMKALGTMIVPWNFLCSETLFLSCRMQAGWWG